MNRALFLTLFWALFGSCTSAPALSLAHDPNVQQVPLGGNAWVTNGATLSAQGLHNWTRSDQVCTVYFKVSQAGTLRLSLMGNAVNSRIEVSLADEPKTVRLRGEADVFAGEWTVKTAGYVVVTLRGLEKEGATFGEIRAIAISGSSINAETAYVKNNEGNYFYWGRRGPSVHLNFATEGLEQVEWFYSEIIVPEQQDVVGSYYMANGFKEGYFGIQVNSATERRVLFSIWSPYSTDDPSKIPDDQKIRLLQKGPEVYAGEFGNEGSGGQSYLKYPWQAGKTYGFLVGAKPDSSGYTTYTAYFYAPDEGAWRLIAQFSRPKTTTYLKGLYSFLENFLPETGHLSREALYGNQWAYDTHKGWVELTHTTFTADATARIGYRKDYAGGQKGAQFFLRNCGFFNETTPIRTPFQRPALNRKPPKLPALSTE
jgi:hypothetical protein